MTTAQLIARYTPAVDIISLVFCCLLIFVIEKVLFFSQDRKFVILKRALFFIFIGAFWNIGFYYTAKFLPQAEILIFAFEKLYHFSLLLCLYSFILYMKHMIDEDRKLEKSFIYITRGVFTACVVLDLLSPFTHMGFHRENGLWVDPMLSPYNFFYVYAYILLFLMLLLYSKRIIKYVRTCLAYTGIIIGCIMTYQGIAGINTYTCFTYILPVFIVMILLHSKPFNDKTGALDSTSFDSFLKQSTKRKTPVDFIILQLNYSLLGTIPDELGKVLNSFWHDTFKDALSFNLSSDVFVLAIPREKKNGDTEEKINYLINDIFYKYYSQYRVPYKLIGMMDVDFIENLTDISGITSYLLVNMEENSTLILDEKQKAAHRIMKKVKENLADIESKNDLDDPRVLVYFQPVRNMKTGEFDTAEALMRMQLEETGIVMPYMFISMAEEYGYITTLTKIMLNKVCKELKQLENEGYAFKRVSVNVSAVDMRVDGFCEEIINIIKSNGLDLSKIGIELTESQTDRDFMMLKTKMKILHDAGIYLYLDDVGTGYSNLDRIVHYDVDVVKFDRFFLLEAEKNIKNIKMMTHLSQAFQDLDYKLLFEGVETEAHEALCMNCGADYIQGFKYSKPVPVEELKKFFKKDGEEAAVSHELPVKQNQDFSYKELQDQYSILVTMSKLFYSMHVIDLIKNTAKPYNPTEDVKVVDVVNSTMGADEMMKQIMRMCTVEEYADAAIEFTDLTTIADRMTGKKILSGEFIGKSIGWYAGTFYTIEADKNERPTKVVFTTISIEDRKKS